VSSTIAIPENAAKEWVSLAYVKAIAAQAGLNINSWSWDDGVDICIGASKTLPGFPEFFNLDVSLQLKATCNWKIKNGAISFPLNASNYDKLRDERTASPQYLVLYTLPPSRTRWIVGEEGSNRFSHNAYYISLLNSPALQPRSNGRPRKTKSVKVPAVNKLNAGSLLRLYRNACESYSRLRGG